MKKEKLTVGYLKNLHRITTKKAKRLLAFAKENTIIYKACYGNGSIIYPKWIESIKP